MQAAPKKLPFSAILRAAAVRSQISGHEDRIFNFHLPANPMKSKYGNWSEWQNPDFVAKADQQPTRFSAETITRFDTRWITRTGSRRYRHPRRRS